MKKKPLILVAFLMLSLCMIPNVTAGYGDESPQSITSFSETLPDDVLFYPDAFGAGVSADAGSANGTTGYAVIGDYERTHVLDAYAYACLDGSGPSTCDIYLNFTVPSSEYQIESLDISSYADVSNGDGNISIWNHNSESWVVKYNIPVPLGVYSYCDFSVYDSDYWTGGIVWLQFRNDHASSSTNIRVDYSEVTYNYMTLADSEHYTESFADGSDISVSAGSISTDGDVLSWEYEFTGDNQWIYLWSNVPGAMSQELYREIRWQTNATLEFFRSYAYSEDDRAGTSGYEEVFGYDPATSWTTYKGFQDYTSDFTIECLCIGIRADTGVKIKMELDYDRYGPADEMGWSHDCSTTTGISTGAGGSISSDGDVVNCSSSVAGREFQFVFDTTSTVALSEGDYYQFLEISIDAVSDGDGDNLVWRPRITDGTTYEYLADKQGSSGVFRYNVKASTVPDIKYIYLYIDDDLDWFTVEHVKLFSIANYTVSSGAGIDTSDYLYVDSGKLCSSYSGSGGSGDDWLRLYNDVPLSVATETFNVWNVTANESGTGEYGGYKYRFYPYLHLDIRDDSNYDVSRNDFIASATFTNFYFYVYDDLELSAITFIDDHTWRGFTTITVWFEVIAFTGNLNMLLIFGGLILIPASTLYAVKGGREEMNTDKLFYVLIAFTIGWALVIGGIYA